MQAVIVSHGQPGDPLPQQAAIEALATNVAAHIPGITVAGATLAMPGAIESTCPAATLIYPMFMAEGWFTRSELPRRLREAGAGEVTTLPPFGADPSLPALIADCAEAAAQTQGWSPLNSTVLLSAHGSQRSQASFESTRQIAQIISPRFARVLTGFVEQDPKIADAARGLNQAISLPLFALNAEHVQVDLPKALDAAGFTGPRLAPIGLAAQVPAIIGAAITRALRQARG